MLQLTSLESGLHRPPYGKEEIVIRGFLNFNATPGDLLAWRRVDGAVTRDLCVHYLRSSNSPTFPLNYT